MVNFNGHKIASFSPPARAAKYGDGLFETIRVIGGQIPFWPAHWHRLQQGLRVLKFDSPKHYSSDFFKEEVLKQVGGRGNHRVRLTIWRNSEGLYTPQKNEPIFLIESGPITNGSFVLNHKGISLGIYRENHLPMAKNASSEKYFLPNIKTCNSLPFILANIYRKENDFDDILLLNTAGRIACGGSSNVFIWEDGELHTPALSEGCVAGTMRQTLFKISNKLGIKIVERKIFQKELKDAESVFLSNSISGLKWVNRIAGIKKEYKIGNSSSLINALNNY